MINLKACAFHYGRWSFATTPEDDAIQAYYKAKLEERKNMYPNTEPPRGHDYKEESLARTKRNLKMLVGCNFSPSLKFLTLTFAQPCTDRESVAVSIKAMCKRYLLIYGHPLQYLSVLELHPGGHGYHVHMLVNSFYIRQQTWQDNLWARGIVHIKAVNFDGTEAGYRRIANYLLKYIEKDFDNLPANSKRYTLSESWPRPAPGMKMDAKNQEEAEKNIRAMFKEKGITPREYLYTTPTGEIVTCFEGSRPKTPEELSRV